MRDSLFTAKANIDLAQSIRNRLEIMHKLLYLSSIDSYHLNYDEYNLPANSVIC